MSRNTTNNFGKRVKFLRKNRGITQEELAHLIGRSEDTVSNIERGICSTKMETVVDIAKALDVSISDLFDLPIVEWKGCGIEKKAVMNQILKICYQQDIKTLNVILNNIEKITELLTKK